MSDLTIPDLNRFLSDKGVVGFSGKPVSLATLQAIDAKAHGDGFKEGKLEGEERGLAKGAGHERKRINAILSSEEAAERQTQAMTIALDSDLSAEAAKKMLATMPEERYSKGMTEFEKHMAQNANDSIHADSYREGMDDPNSKQAVEASWQASIHRTSAKDEAGIHE